MLKHPVFFAGKPGSSHGWGVCNAHLLAELSKLTAVEHLVEGHPLHGSPCVPGHLFAPVRDNHLALDGGTRGRFNHGYTFFENELMDDASANARRLDRLFAGSRWCQAKLEAIGVASTLLIQGVDGGAFAPAGPRPPGGPFVVFSGGKFEYRKGQDLVLRAIAELQARHPDIILVNAWFNQWPESMASMARSPHIRFEMSGSTWPEIMGHLYALNGIDARRVFTMGLVPRERMAAVYRKADLGLFPNRCEGGTNLVLMECMASGVPVVASGWSGHADVVNAGNAFVLDPAREVELATPEGRTYARWREPDVGEIVRLVEAARADRAALRLRADRAAADMRGFTWAGCARAVHDALAALEG